MNQDDTPIDAIAQARLRDAEEMTKSRAIEHEGRMVEQLIDEGWAMMIDPDGWSASPPRRFVAGCSCGFGFYTHEAATNHDCWLQEDPTITLREEPE